MTNDNVLAPSCTAGTPASSADTHFDDPALGLANVPAGIVGPHDGIDTPAGGLVHPPAL